MQKGAALDVLEIGIVRLLHLPMQNFHAVKAHLVGHVDTFFDVAQIVVLELPERIGGDADAIGDVLISDKRISIVTVRIIGGGDGSNSSSGCARENLAAGDHERLLFQVRYGGARRITKPTL